ncbi:MAG TPA: UbiA family prenyltransferase, partial [Candidatus Poseidoniales archaeon]|nr:UbiA family prenyltransferase [Candidatus Poseidoniales archaeon]
LALVTYALALFGQLSYEIGPCYKRRGFQGNLVIALLLGLVMFHAVTAVGQAGHPRAWFMAGVAMAANLASEIIKDCEDLSGDIGRFTLPSRIGLPRSRLIAYFLIMTSITLTLVAFGVGTFPQWALFVMLPSLFLLFSLKPLLAHEADHRAQRRLRGAIILGLLGFLTAALLESA